MKGDTIEGQKERENELNNALNMALTLLWQQKNRGVEKFCMQTERDLTSGDFLTFITENGERTENRTRNRQKQDEMF